MDQGWIHGPSRAELTILDRQLLQEALSVLNVTHDDIEKAASVQSLFERERKLKALRTRICERRQPAKAVIAERTGNPYGECAYRILCALDSSVKGMTDQIEMALLDLEKAKPHPQTKRARGSRPATGRPDPRYKPDPPYWGFKRRETHWRPASKS